MDRFKVKYFPLIGIVIISAITYLLIERKSDKLYVSPKYTEIEGLDLAKNVMITGNENSYSQLAFAPIDIIPYTFVMANKYNSANACWDMYEYIHAIFEKNNIEIDSMSEAIALGYLKKAADLRDTFCIENIIPLYEIGGTNIAPDSVLAKYYRDLLNDIRREEKTHDF